MVDTMQTREYCRRQRGDDVSCKTTLALQGPDDGSEYLLEALILHSVDAVRAGAAFAWATVVGINLLFNDQAFIDCLTTASFELIVGVDDVTTPEALARLAQAESQHPGLNVRAFMSNSTEALFHPKMTWFRRAKSGSLIVGSGNLTGGGLWNNREAYTVTEYEEAQIAEIESQWAAWRTTVAARLYRVTDPLIIERAGRNKRWNGKRKAVAAAAPIPPSSSVVKELESRAVLIAQIPKGGPRWHQANFHKEDFTDFFGATPAETQKRIRLRSIDRLDQLRDEEPTRPAVARKSRNWSFELSAARGKTYPTGDRPIGVFLRLRKRTFVYALLMPGDPHYSETLAYLKTQPSKANQMRRAHLPVDKVGGLGVVQALVKASESAFESDLTD